MNKHKAISLFGTVPELAKALGLSRQAIYQWPDELPQATTDRVIGAAIRHGKALPDDIAESRSTEIKGAA